MARWFPCCITDGESESNSSKKIESHARPSGPPHIVDETHAVGPPIKTKQVTPSTGMYLRQGARAFATNLESISGFIPVPLVSELLKVAIRVIEACDDVTIIEESVKELQERVYSLSLVIAHAIPAEDQLSEELQSRIEKLQSDLSEIIEDLDEIKQQQKGLLVLFPEANKDRVGKCLGRLDVAIEQFHVAHQLRAEELLEKIYSKYSHLTDRLPVIFDHIKSIEEGVKDLKQLHGAPSIGRQALLQSPPIFYGRDDTVRYVATLLANKDTSRVCINGPGGIGKTGVSLAVIHSPIVKDTFPKYRFWVPCIKATSPSLLLRILCTQLSITAESYDDLDALINELNASEDRRLLLLDNFETPWFSEDAAEQAQVRDILNRMAELPHVALMVTMTSAFAPDPPSGDVQWQSCTLSPLDATAARETFERMYPEVTGTAEVDELLEAIGHTPLAITLMAADGKRLRTSAADLLREWANAGTDMISGMDRTISLSVHRVKSNAQALTILAILSMLPAGTPGNNLYWWAAKLTSHLGAVAELLAAALVEQGDGDFGTSRIFVRPTIQAYMHQRERIPPDVKEQVHNACYTFVLNHKSVRVPDDINFKADLAALAEEETNIQGLLMQVNANNVQPNALEALVAFSHYQFRTKPSIVVAKHALQVACAARDDRCIAEAHQVLGEISLRLGRYDDACQHFQEASRCFRTLPSGADLPCAGECLMQLAKTWMYIQTKGSREILPLVLEAQSDLSHNADDTYHVARGLLGLGSFLWWATRRDEALEELSAAKEEFERLGCSASTSECLFLLARVYASRNDYEKALRLAQNALKTGEQSGDSAVIGQALRTTARCLIVTRDYDEAENIIEASLLQSRALGHPLAIAQNLELLGYNSALKGDVRESQAAYDSARAQYSSMGSTMMEGRGVAICVENLRKLSRGQIGGLTKPMLY